VRELPANRVVPPVAQLSCVLQPVCGLVFSPRVTRKAIPLLATAEKGEYVKKVTMIAAALSLLVLPAGASAGAKKEAAKDCRAERSAAGVENFRTLYDDFGQCVTQTKRENRAERRQARREAVADCDSEDLEGTELEQCVRSERKKNMAEAEAEDQAELNAARDCRAERDEIGDEEFVETYGTNHNKKNAFGKCVSGRVQEQDGEETESDDVDEENSAGGR
jgi:hypothetical protein